jgi:hypothetical protein
MLFDISLGPPVRTPLSVRAPLEPIKGRVRSLEHRLGEALGSSGKLSRVPQVPQIYKQYSTQVDVRFYAPAV